MPIYFYSHESGAHTCRQCKFRLRRLKKAKEDLEAYLSNEPSMSEETRLALVEVVRGVIDEASRQEVAGWVGCQFTNRLLDPLSRLMARALTTGTRSMGALSTGDMTHVHSESLIRRTEENLGG